MKLVDAVNDLLERTAEIIREEQYSDYMLERVFRMREDLVEPSLRLLRNHPKYLKAAKTLGDLFAATEEYVVTWQQSSVQQRLKRRQKVEGLRALARRQFLPSQDREGEVEHLLDELRKWQVKTALDASGRLVFTTPSGASVPAREIIAEKAGQKVIEQAVKAQRPYADKVRPRNIVGEPGGLLLIEEGERVIVVGDLHGRYDNLEFILKDKNNLQDILSGKAHLVFTGDAVHPRSSAMESPTAYEDSFCVMLLIMTMKAENPFNVHYLIGNHDAAHVGGIPAGRGMVRQDKLFEKFVIEKFGQGTFDRYCEFVRNSPAAAKVKFPNGNVMLVHACLSPRVLSEQGLINIFVKGRQSLALQDLLWSRNYSEETIRKCLKTVDARFVISGHTGPSAERAKKYGFDVIAEGVCAHVHNLQLIMMAQGNIFGYVDLDLTTPLPDMVYDLRTKDGKRACRVMVPRTIAEHLLQTTGHKLPPSVEEV